ncbi:MAG: response regulator transcription factor [Myxococcota bacterium]
MSFARCSRVDTTEWNLLALPGVSVDETILALLVEDDERLAALTKEYLVGHGIAVTHLARAEDGLIELRNTRYDVVLLDLMLPGIDGLEACRRIRETSDVPIIVLTARGEEADRVMGLELGADDYLSKPFSPRELLARIRALLRRARGQVGPATKPLHSGALELDPARREARFQGGLLDLTGYEFDLLRILVERAGRIQSRDALMESVRGSADESYDRTVDVHVSRLRHKLTDAGASKDAIKTVRGVGYLWAGPS